MKLKLYLIAGFLLSGMAFPLNADQPLVWDTPYGLFNLNVETSEELIGYDAILKQAIGGVAQPIYTDPKGIITFHIGAGAPWPVGNQATIQPIFMAGHNILKEIPGINQYPDAQMNVFARYVSGNGRAGVGVAFSYSPGGVASPSNPTVASPVPSSVSKLNLYPRMQYARLPY